MCCSVLIYCLIIKTLSRLIWWERLPINLSTVQQINCILQLLGIAHLSNKEFNRGYVLQTQDDIVGGFSKWPDASPDPLHSYLGLGGLSLISEEGTWQFFAPLWNTATIVCFEMANVVKLNVCRYWVNFPRHFLIYLVYSIWVHDISVRFTTSWPSIER